LGEDKVVCGWHPIGAGNNESFAGWRISIYRRTDTRAINGAITVAWRGEEGVASVVRYLIRVAIPGELKGVIVRLLVPPVEQTVIVGDEC
jgi:hypothetical protein